MKKIGIFYSFNTNKTAKVAERLKEAFDKEEVELVNVEETNTDEFLSFDNLICGTATWFDGELPNQWDEFVPDLEDMDLKGKTIALYGLGNQSDYPENFLDAMGILADVLAESGAKIAGHTPTEGYSYEHSGAERDGKFCGLGLDFENQASMNKERIASWVEQLRKEFT